MCIVNEEMKSIKHVSVILQDRYFESRFDNLLDLVFGLLSVMDEFDAFLLILFSKQI